MNYELSITQILVNKAFAFLLLLCFVVPFEISAKIVFSSKRKQWGDTAYHIYVMEDNGSNVRRITNPTYYDHFPKWFPDGDRILFERDLSRGKGAIFNAEFYVINVLDLVEHRFMDNHPTDIYPTVSPNGKEIAFSSRRNDRLDIYVLHLESNDLKQLTNNIMGDGISYRMDWSPDGRKIAYEHTAHDGDNIWIMNVDGTQKKCLSPPMGANPISRGVPSWSPSGKYIMYAETEITPDLKRLLARRLIIQNVFTGHRDEHLFPKESLIASGCWMGDDSMVLLAVKENHTISGANYEIFRYDLKNRKMTNLTQQPGGDYHPHWIDGSLSVSPLDKLTIRWAQLKQKN